MQVKLINLGSHLSLTVGKEYEVLAIEGDYYRILTDSDSKYSSNDPVLFESECFELTDSKEPDFWITEYIDGQRYCRPFVWSHYFFEDYHDGIEKVRLLFKQHLKQYYPWTWKERFGI
jgi:hypothetical protein